MVSPQKKLPAVAAYRCLTPPRQLLLLEDTILPNWHGVGRAKAREPCSATITIGIDKTVATHCRNSSYSGKRDVCSVPLNQFCTIIGPGHSARAALHCDDGITNLSKGWGETQRLCHFRHRTILPLPIRHRPSAF